MKIVISKRAKRIILAAIAACLITWAAINIIGYFFDCKYVSVIAAVSEADKYEVRSKLLMEAMDKFGVCDPKEAALLWAEGLRMRSGAIQYSAMDKGLKEKYKKQLERNFPNWVTGGSSPWIESYKIISNELRNDVSTVVLDFYTETSTGPAGEYKASLILKPEGGFWRITDINADQGLNMYTGFGEVWN